jgi:hypothetical protein
VNAAGPSPAPQAGERVRACERLLALSRRIRDDLERDDWGAAAALEAERRGLVELIFDGAPPAADLPALTATLREVVRVNDELVGLAEHRRRALERDADLVALGRTAVRAYAASAADGRIAP